MDKKKVLAISIVAFLIAALVVPVAVWVFVPRVENVGGLLGFDRSQSRWTLATSNGEAVHYYQIRDPELLARWVDCDQCIYSADLRLKIFSRRKGEMHGGEVVGYETEVVHVWNIKRSHANPDCRHK